MFSLKINSDKSSGLKDAAPLITLSPGTPFREDILVIIRLKDPNFHFCISFSFPLKFAVVSLTLPPHPPQSLPKYEELDPTFEFPECFESPTFMAK